MHSKKQYPKSSNECLHEHNVLFSSLTRYPCVGFTKSRKCKIYRKLWRHRAILVYDVIIYDPIFHLILCRRLLSMKLHVHWIFQSPKTILRCFICVETIVITVSENNKYLLWVKSGHHFSFSYYGVILCVCFCILFCFVCLFLFCFALFCWFFFVLVLFVLFVYFCFVLLCFVGFFLSWFCLFCFCFFVFFWFCFI